MTVNLKKLNDKTIVPTQGHTGDAGWDLYACLENPIIIYPGETAMVPTGFSLEIPEGYFGGIFPRSGLSTKQGLRLANCVGVVDAPYRGEVMVALYNDSNVHREISHGDRIAQMIILPVLGINFNIVDNLTNTDRGSGGFGSTGAN